MSEALTSTAGGPAEHGNWKGVWEILKFHEDENDPAILDGTAVPYEVVTVENVVLLVGWNELIRILVGASANTFTQPNTQIGIGDSSTAAANTQTDLQASTNKFYQVLDASGGLVVGANGGTTNTLIVQTTIGTSNANFSWQELVIKQSVSGICLNRAVANMGTKSSGTWIAKCTITLT